MRALLLAASVFTLAVTTAAPATSPASDADAAAARALAPVPPGRLTDAARPLAYRIDLSVDPNKERFSGKVEIDGSSTVCANANNASRDPFTGSTSVSGSSVTP